MSETTIGITGLQSGPSPSPGIAVARCLRESGERKYRLIGLASHPLTAGLYLSDVFDQTHIIPPWHMSNELLLYLERNHQELGLTMLIPTLDVEQAVFKQLERRLSRIGIATLLPPLKALKDLSKESLCRTGKRLRLSIPYTTVANDYDELQTSIASARFPLVVKGHTFDAVICSHIQEALSMADLIVARWDYPILLQEHIIGQEYSVAALAGRDANLIGVIAMKKLGITEKGKAWSGVTVKSPHLVELVERLVRHHKWIGPIEVDFIKDEEGTPFIIDVNPRFPSWIRLAAAAGYNLVESLVSVVLGEETNLSDDYDAGIVFARYSNDIPLPLQAFARFAAQGESGNAIL